MDESSSEEVPSDLKFFRIGSWQEITSVCEEVSTILGEVRPGKLGDHITQKQFDMLLEEWEDWRPHSTEDFSEEMREKTAEQSCLNESELEEDNKKPSEEMKNAGNSIVKATEDAEEKGLEEAKDLFAEAVKSAGKAVDTTLRQGMRNVEKKIYENIILKANSLYFDNSVLNAVLSKRIGADSSEKYKLTLHSNNPHLRRFFSERLDWNDS